MDEVTTFDIRVYKTDVYKGARVTTYKVHWKAGHRPWKEGFRSAQRRAIQRQHGPPGLLEA